MKGKRKTKTTKWLTKGRFETEARLLLKKRSHKASHRFLDAVLTSGDEPVGLLAGSRKRSGYNGLASHVG